MASKPSHKSPLAITSTSVGVEITIKMGGNDINIGGHEHSFIGSIPHKYICVICTNVQREPAIVSCCGQHFCQSCLETSFKYCPERSRPKCPHCLATDPQYFVNKQQRREIACLLVRCSNEDRGCEWVGELGDLKTHINRRCERVTVYCPWKCGEKVERRELKTHQELHCQQVRRDSCGVHCLEV